jgi:ribosomal protein S18 acetylase RimI-like enzyme
VEQGASVVRLWVGQGNRPAQQLYERHGFHRTGLVQPVRADDPDDPRMEQEMRHTGG